MLLITVIIFIKIAFQYVQLVIQPFRSVSGEGFWFDLSIIKDVLALARPLFPVVDYAISNIPAFPGGHLGFILCSTSSVGIRVLHFISVATKMKNKVKVKWRLFSGNSKNIFRGSKKKKNICNKIKIFMPRFKINLFIMF